MVLGECNFISSGGVSYPPLVSKSAALFTPTFLEQKVFSALLTLIAVRTSKLISQVIGAVGELFASSPMLAVARLRFSPTGFSVVLSSLTSL